MPKSGDDKMIRGHSINLLHLFDTPQKFKVMSLIVETVKRTAADQKRSCGFAPHIQLLINSKAGTSTYLLDREHLPLRPEFEDNVVVMDPSHPTSVDCPGEGFKQLLQLKQPWEHRVLAHPQLTSRPRQTK